MTQPLKLKALLFDVFGTVVDWRSAVVSELQELGTRTQVSSNTNWAKFAQEWRDGGSIASGTSEGPLNVDVMHREILDDLLSSPNWSHVSELWDEETRGHLNLVWHRLKGWPDSVEGLYALKKNVIIATLSNGNVRLLVDMAKYADLPWDMVFSTELFQTFKPNPKAYLTPLRHLSVHPEESAMVAAHIGDLRAAAKLGMKTIYVRRPEEETLGSEGDVKSKEEGGEVDWVVDSFVELADLVALGAQV